MTTPEHVIISDYGSTFYEDASNVRSMYDLGGFTFSHLEWPACAWPGGYPIFYVVKDMGILCPHCANNELNRTIDPDDDQFYVVAADINEEDPDLFCDHCGKQIESAYGEEDDTDR